MEGPNKFSHSYDHYEILCKLASGHALTCLREIQVIKSTVKFRKYRPSLLSDLAAFSIASFGEARYFQGVAIQPRPQGAFPWLWGRGW